MKHLLLLGFFWGFVALAQTPGDIPQTYVVQPGDTCMGIAKKVYGNASEYTRIHKYNALGPLPHNLKAGDVIRLRDADVDKTASLPSDAVLTAFGATVNVRSAQRGEWKPAQLHHPLFRLDEVHTLSGAFADILFQDNSTLQMKQNALVIIYGGKSSKVHLRKTAGIQLIEGELGVSLADLRKPPAAIATPSAEISVRAKEALIYVDAQQTSRVSVQSGEAKITAQGKSVSLKSGQGTRIQKNAAPEPPMQLPSPPAWEDANPHELHVSYGTRKTTALLPWAQPPSPGLFRVEVSEDSLFQKLTLATTTDKPFFPLSELDSGTFYVRVRALNNAGLVGSPSLVKRLDILQVGEADTPAQEVKGQAPKVVGQVPFAVSENLPEDIQIFVDGARVSPPLVLGTPGTYSVEFKTMDGKQSVPARVQALPPPCSLERGLGPEGNPQWLLRFEAAIPQDAALKLQAPDGSFVEPLLREDERTFKANALGQPSLRVRAFWGSYLLDCPLEDKLPQAELQQSLLQKDETTPAAPEATQASLFPLYVQPLSILRERRLGSLALPTAYLPQRLQLNTALDLDFSKEKTGATMARMAARMDGPFKQGDYFINLALVNYIGSNNSLVYPEVAAGVHMQFPLKKNWTAGFASDLSGNLNTLRARQESFLRLRGMGLLGYQTKAFFVSATQGIAGECANSLRAAWIGSISASWHVRAKFLLAAQWDSQKTAGRGYASAAAAGFRLLVGPVEVGVMGHAGLTSEGRSQWGDYGASLTFGIR